MLVSAYNRTVNGHVVAVSAYERTGQGKNETAADPAALRSANPNSRLHSDLEAPPPFVKQLLKANPPATWESMVLALEKADLGPNRVFAYANVFAAEGGVLKDPKGTASSGITTPTLRQAQAAAPSGSSLKNVKVPSDLTFDQRVQVYDYYFDKALARVGGAIALDGIPDKQVAAAVADTLFRHGPEGGTFLLEQAINTVRWSVGLPSVDMSKLPEEPILTSLIILSLPETKTDLLTAIKGFRDNRVLPSELARVQYFSTWK